MDEIIVARQRFVDTLSPTLGYLEMKGVPPFATSSTFFAYLCFAAFFPLVYVSPNNLKLFKHDFESLEVRVGSDRPLVQWIQNAKDDLQKRRWGSVCDLRERLDRAAAQDSELERTQRFPLVRECLDAFKGIDIDGAN